jgi:hypothetical protein
MFGNRCDWLGSRVNKITTIYYLTSRPKSAWRKLQHFAPLLYGHWQKKPANEGGQKFPQRMKKEKFESEKNHVVILPRHGARHQPACADQMTGAERKQDYRYCQHGSLLAADGRLWN